MCQVSKDDTIITAPNESEQTSDGACGASTKTTASGIVRNSRRSRKNRSTCNEVGVKTSNLILFSSNTALMIYSDNYNSIKQFITVLSQ